MKVTISILTRTMVFALILIPGIADAQTAAVNSSDSIAAPANNAEFRLALQDSIERFSGNLFPAFKRPPRAGGSVLNAVPASLNLQVLGSGTVGRLTRWTGFNSTNSSRQN